MSTQVSIPSLLMFRNPERAHTIELLPQQIASSGIVASREIAIRRLNRFNSRPECVPRLFIVPTMRWQIKRLPKYKGIDGGPDISSLGNIKEIMLDVEGFAFASSNSSFPFVPLWHFTPAPRAGRQTQYRINALFPSLARHLPPPTAARPVGLPLPMSNGNSFLIFSISLIRHFQYQFVVDLHDELAAQMFACVEPAMHGNHGELDDIRRSALHRRIDCGAFRRLPARLPLALLISGSHSRRPKTVSTKPLCLAFLRVSLHIVRHARIASEVAIYI